MFFALFGAIALVGVLGATTMTVMQGPVRGMSDVTRYTIVDNDIIASVAILSELALSQPNADCDADGMIEPLPYKTAPAGRAPQGGGHIPDIAGTRKQDPWKNAYGYCAWDHGSKTIADNIPACGGTNANRLSGGDNSTTATIAIISAGPDRVFQSICRDYVDETTPTVEIPDGSDDRVTIVPYAQFLLPRMAQAVIGELPDEACTAQTPGLMRTSLGVVQICADTGWTEVGTAASSDANFIPVTNAALSSEHVSNEISFTGFLSKKPLIVIGEATLYVDGVVKTPPLDIASGQTIALRAYAPGQPEQTFTYGISLGGVRKTWTITSRDAYPAVLTITPSTSTAMNVLGPGSPAYGPTTVFQVTNTGERASNTISHASLSNTTNFEFDNAGIYKGDDCAGKTLATSQSCTIDIRPKASNDGLYSATLTVTDGNSTVSASLSGEATGWTCSLPWGGTIADGQSIDAYLSDNITCGSSCTKEVRTCSGGTLSGSYTKQSCNATANCTYAWYQSGFSACSASPYWGGYGSYGSCSRTCGGGTQTRYRDCLNTSGTRTQTVYCYRSDNSAVPVSDSFCSGSKPQTSQACSASCSGSSSDSRSCNTHSCCSGGGSCSPYTSGVCAGGCGGHYQGTTWCASTWTSTSCPSGCTKVMNGSYSFSCR